MGKLKDLWGELRTTKDSVKRKEIQKNINDIEQWMIDSKIGTITEKTDWSNTIKYEDNFDKRFENPRYPWHTNVVYMEDVWMSASLNGGKGNLTLDKITHKCSECL